MTRWQKMEEWLIDHEDETFSAEQLAASMKCSVWQASYLINGHLTAQRGARSKTLYVLKRQGRTRNARWSVAKRTADIDAINGTLFGDISVKIKASYRPDLRRLAEQNPRAAKRVGMTLDAVVDGALVVMAGALNGVHDTDDE